MFSRIFYIPCILVLYALTSAMAFADQCADSRSHKANWRLSDWRIELANGEIIKDDCHYPSIGSALSVSKEGASSGSVDLVDVSTPPIDETRTVYLGDRMVKSATLSMTATQCRQFKQSMEKKGFGYKLSVPAGGWICKNASDETWIPFFDNLTQKGVYPRYPFKISYSERADTTSIKSSIAGWKVENVDLDRVLGDPIEATAYQSRTDTMQRVIEYMGKNGTTLKFVYSEFSDDLARPAFTREFSIDLNEGNVGAFKGAVFEVEAADNATITYKIIRHFSPF